MARAPQTERSYDVIDVLLFVWKAVMIILAITIGVYSYLTVITSETAHCAGETWLASYRTGALALWVVPLLGIVAIAQSLIRLRRARIRELFSVARYRETIFCFRGIRVTWGALLIYGEIIGSPILMGVMTHFLAVRYHAIASYCRADAVSGESRIWQVATDGGFTETSLMNGTHARNNPKP